MTRNHPAIAHHATLQHGKVTRSQLLELGLSPSAVRRRVRTGTLIPDQRGVFAVGHAPDTPRARWSAAVLAAGSDAALSHLAAARLWDLLPWEPTRIDVSRTRRTRPLPGIVIHASGLAPDEITERDGIAVTSPSRTIADCAQLLSSDQVVRLMREARHRGLLDLTELERYVDPAPRRHGAPRLRAAIERFQGRGRGYRSGFEERLRNVVVTRGAPEPLINVPWPTDRGDVEADQSWPDLNIVLEADGPTHDDPEQARIDARNRAALCRAGWDVHVVHYLAFERDPAAATDAVLAAIRARQQRA